MSSCSARGAFGVCLCVWLIRTVLESTLSSNIFDPYSQHIMHWVIHVVALVTLDAEQLPIMMAKCEAGRPKHRRVNTCKRCQKYALIMLIYWSRMRISNRKEIKWIHKCSWNNNLAFDAANRKPNSFRWIVSPSLLSSHMLDILLQPSD